jgi:FkbM family methyltransferase
MCDERCKNTVVSNVQIGWCGQSRSYDVGLIKLHVPGILTPVALRPETTDLPTFAQIFVAEQYQLSTDIPVRLIVDGGANVGYASIWFANQFREAQIVAIEPEDENVALFRENTASYPQVRLIQAAIWNKPGQLSLVTHDNNNTWLGHWAIRVEEAADVGKSDVKAITIDEILQGTGRKFIDILKLDIEGAEKEVFSDNYANWLSRTNILILELHDRFKPGCSDAVYSAIPRGDFTEHCREGNIFFVRKTPLVE